MNSLTDAKIDFLTMQEIVGSLAKAKSLQDIDAAMRIYHPEGTLTSPSLSSTSVSEVEIRKSLEKFFEIFPDYEVSINGDASREGEYIAWGIIRMTPHGDFNGHRANNVRAELDVFMRFRFRDSRVVFESFQFDLGHLCLQTGLPLTAFTKSVE